MRRTNNLGARFAVLTGCGEIRSVRVHHGGFSAVVQVGDVGDVGGKRYTDKALREQ